MESPAVAHGLRRTRRGAVARRVASCGTILALVVLAAACDDDGGTEPEGAMIVIPDSTGVDIGGNLQIVTRNAAGPVTWSSSAPAVADVEAVGQSGRVTGASPGLAAITAQSGNRSATAKVYVRAPAAIALSEDDVAFAAVEGEEDVAARTVDVENAGETTLRGLAASVSFGGANPWLSASLSGTTAPATLTLSPATASLAAGIYTATVMVSSSMPGVTAETIAVRVVVSD